MKIRTGFVSNSSSSSFILHYKLDDFQPCDHCGRSESTPLDLADVIYRDSDESDSIAGEGVEECVGILTNLWEDSERWNNSEACDYYADLIKKLNDMKPLPSNERVVSVSVNYHCEEYVKIQDMIDSGQVRLIDKEEC